LATSKTGTPSARLDDGDHQRDEVGCVSFGFSGRLFFVSTSNSATNPVSQSAATFGHRRIVSKLRRTSGCTMMGSRVYRGTSRPLKRGPEHVPLKITAF